MKLSIATEVTTSTGLTLVSYSYTDASTLDSADDAANELLAARLLCLADDGFSVPEAA